MKLKNLLTQIATCGALTLAAAAAHAEIYNFTLTGDYAASWQMDSAPVPDISVLNYFSLQDVPGFPTASGLANVFFFSDDVGGGMALFELDFGYRVDSTGPQMYTGPEEAPVFKLGTFELEGYDGTSNYSLTISPVPEPTNLALLLGGVVVMGTMAVARNNRSGVRVRLG